jgi:hypothetical protein
MVHERTPRIIEGFPRRSTVIRSYKYEYTTRASVRASSQFASSGLKIVPKCLKSLTPAIPVRNSARSGPTRYLFLADAAKFA